MPQREVQTDKSDTKVVTCTYPGCDTELVVNVFYAPAKGRCSLHKGKPVVIGALADAVASAAAPDKAVISNTALADLRCPLCSARMIIVKISENMGWLTFGCTNNQCLTAVEIQPRWKPMIIRDYPPKWQDFARLWNADIKDQNDLEKEGLAK